MTKRSSPYTPTYPDPELMTCHYCGTQESVDKYAFPVTWSWTTGQSHDRHFCCPNCSVGRPNDWDAFSRSLWNHYRPPRTAPNAPSCPHGDWPEKLLDLTAPNGGMHLKHLPDGSIEAKVWGVWAGQFSVHGPDVPAVVGIAWERLKRGGDPE